VVGAKEQETRTVNIRNRDDQSTQKMGELIPLDVALQGLKALKEERRQVNKIESSA
jgi:threonyl-tRNA synthetase